MDQDANGHRDDDSAIERLVSSGAGATGVAAGGLLGFLAGGPEGTLAGGAAGALLQDGMKGAVGQIAERLTTRGERERVGACLLLAYELITERLNNDEPLRETSFFKVRQRKEQKALRSEAEELLEGTFLAARDAYEERKVQLLANFYANAAFAKGISAGHLNHLLNSAKLLTYRQLVIIGILGGQTFGRVRSTDYRGIGRLPPSTMSALFEVYQMTGLGLVASFDNSYVLGISDINPSQLQLQGNGVHLFHLLRPETVPDEDKAFFFEALER